MKTVQMTLDQDLVEAVDRVSKQLNTSRSAFTRKALREALANHSIQEQERKHRLGYERYPVTSDEFSVWEGEQAWGDE
jgi:metal-responsive CopG/Arc/MetJ family transcriptional regulator